MPGRIKAVVSDLHMGAGFRSQGNALEDFTCDRELAVLLDELAVESRETGAEVELIVAGDAFEMLQVPHLDSFDPAARYEPAHYRSSTEVDSARKMALIVDGHRSVFNALRDFMALGPPRRSVTFILGNHDLDLFWPAVQDQIRQATSTFGPRFPLLRFEGQFLSREGIYVEHGNQYGERLSRVRDMGDPRDPHDPTQLDLPAGSGLVIDVFNEIERERYWVDGVKPIESLLWYALIFDFRLAARALAWLIRALPGVVVGGLVDRQHSRADLLLQLEDPARVAEFAARYREDEEFRSWLDAEVSQILPAPQEADSASAYARAEVGDAVDRGEAMRQQVHSSLFQAAARCAAQEGAELVVFGHTHQAVAEDLGNGATYFNSGTWTWTGDLTGASKETWRDLFEHPERYTESRRLAHVRIDYDEDGKPVGQLMVQEIGRRSPWLPPLQSWWKRFLGWLSGVWQRVVRLFGHLGRE